MCRELSDVYRTKLLELNNEGRIKDHFLGFVGPGNSLFCIPACKTDMDIKLEVIHELNRRH